MSITRQIKTKNKVNVLNCLLSIAFKKKHYYTQKHSSFPNTFNHRTTHGIHFLLKNKTKKTLYQISLETIFTTFTRDSLDSWAAL